MLVTALSDLKLIEALRSVIALLRLIAAPHCLSLKLSFVIMESHFCLPCIPTPSGQVYPLLRLGVEA
jgi:hypothetical protein